MRKNFGQKTWLYPMPVLIIGTYAEDGTPNAMNAAWGGISEETEITICVDNTHKTAENLLARKAFTVSMATAGYLTACDYVGIVSGNKEPDKFAKAGFHAVKSTRVNAPLIQELPMALECKVKSFEDGILVGEIVNVCADESVLTDGKIDPKKLKPIAFDSCNNTYVFLGDVVGIAFSDGLKLKGIFQNINSKTVCECNIVSEKEGKTGIVILKIQGFPHPLWHLVNETEDTFVMTGTILIHQTILEFDSQFLIIVFLDF